MNIPHKPICSYNLQKQFPKGIDITLEFFLASLRPLTNTDRKDLRYWKLKVTEGYEWRATGVTLT
jgi:hypothetical protein